VKVEEVPNWADGSECDFCNTPALWSVGSKLLVCETCARTLRDTLDNTIEDWDDAILVGLSESRVK